MAHQMNENLIALIVTILMLGLVVGTYFTTVSVERERLCNDMNGTLMQGDGTYKCMLVGSLERCIPESKVGYAGISRSNLQPNLTFVLK